MACVCIVCACVVCVCVLCVCALCVYKCTRVCMCTYVVWVTCVKLFIQPQEFLEMGDTDRTELKASLQLERYKVYCKVGFISKGGNVPLCSCNCNVPIPLLPISV